MNVMGRSTNGSYYIVDNATTFAAGGKRYVDGGFGVGALQVVNDVVEHQALPEANVEPTEEDVAANKARLRAEGRCYDQVK